MDYSRPSLKPLIMIVMNKLFATFQVFLLISSAVQAEISPLNATDPWSFVVFADWHGAETFALYPVNASMASTVSEDDNFAYNNSLRVLNHIYETYGGDLALLPGDSNVGKWQKKPFLRKMRRMLGVKVSMNEAIAIAGENCYGTMHRMFIEAGYNTSLMCIGDHELGGNPWFNQSETDIKALPMFRKALAYEYLNNTYSFNTTIFGNVTSTPVGTPYEHTSYAYIHKNALFVTVDAFQKQNQNYFDRESSSGGEGAVTCTVTDDHLTWFETLLSEANNEPSIRHIFVQAHIPILQPVRKINCSGQYMDRAYESAFWKVMRQFNVDVYFAGEVHATSASKDPQSNLIQIISRANRFNNFLTVNVTDNGFTIAAYNEIGTEWRWNANYTKYGMLTVDKSTTNTQITSNGILKVLDLKKPLIQLKFDRRNVFPLQERIIVGMKYNQYKQMLGGYSKEIRGVNSTEGMINFGDFGQQYDAQITNLTFDKGINGQSAAIFSQHSRVAIGSFGPMGMGEMISFSFFFKTNSTKEMILAAYGSQYSPHYRNDIADLMDEESYDIPKDLLLLSLKNGVPHLYVSHRRYILSSIQEGILNDNEWNSIAISMPSKSCLMSEIKIYINGSLKPTEVIGSNTRMFFYTTGSLSLGGWGYAHEHNELLFPNVTHFTGSMDEFNLWGRSISSKDLKKSMKKKFVRNMNVICDGTQSELSAGKRSPKKCRAKCKNRPSCWGYELIPLEEGGYECFVYNERSRVGNNTVQGGQCNPAF